MLALHREKVYLLSRKRVLPQSTNLTQTGWKAGVSVHTHIIPELRRAAPCGCCKTNGRECEHGLSLAPMANQVCSMSHCCDYRHGALAQLEAPQVNQRGELNICSAGGPQTMLMGLHLLLGH